jgi:hypothetical protein
MSVFTRKSREIRVEGSGFLGKGMTLTQVEEFCKEAREQNFQGKDTVWVGNSLIFNMHLSRTEPE